MISAGETMSMAISHLWSGSYSTWRKLRDGDVSPLLDAENRVENLRIAIIGEYESRTDQTSPVTLRTE